MEKHNQTLREWVQQTLDKAKEPGSEGPEYFSAFKEVLDWLDENHVDVEPGFVERYQDQMTLAKGIYLDVIEALNAAGHEADITQTGGMCLAISWMASDDSGDYFLLTDKEDVLSWRRSPEQGWALGRYPGGEDADDTAYFVDVCDHKHPVTAVLMANHAYSGGRP